MVLMLPLFRCTSPSIVANQSIQRGDYFNNANNYPEAIANYERYLELSPRLGVYRNPKMEAEVCRKLAHVYSTQGAYNKALDYLKRGLLLDSLNANTLEIVDDHLLLGEVNGFTGDYKSALRHLNYSLHLTGGMAQSIKNTKRASLARTYLSLARVHLTLGNLGEAGNYSRSALAIFTELRQNENVLEVRLILGIISRDRGLLDDAIREVLESKRLAQQGGLNTSRQDQTLGDIYFQRGDPEEGIRYKLLALEEARKTKIQPQILVAYTRLGDAYQQLGDRVHANYYYQEALKLQQKMQLDNPGIGAAGLNSGDAKLAYSYFIGSGSTIGAGIASLRLGELKLKENKSDSARELLIQAKELFGKAQNNEGIIKTDLLLADLAISQNQDSAAIRLFEEVLGSHPQHEALWQVWYGRGRLFEKNEMPDSAIHAYRKAARIIDELRTNLSVEEFKTYFANNKVHVFDRLIMLLARQGMKHQKNDLLEESFSINEQSRSRTFLDMLGNRKIDPKSLADTVLLEQEQLLRLKINKLVASMNDAEDQSPVTLAQFRDELVTAQFEYDNLIQRIKLLNDNYSSVLNIMPPPMHDIQQELPDKTAVVEYWVGETGLMIWVITKGDFNARMVDVPAGEVLRLVRGCRTAIASRDNTVMHEMLTRMRDWLITPIADLLDGYERLVIVPHRGLHFLPFAALSKNNRFLVEDYVISLSPSLAVYHYCLNKQTGAGDKLLGMVLGETPIGSHPPLPGTETEIRHIAELYDQATIRKEEDFTESYFKAYAGGYDYLHIATHGIFNDLQPLYSYLLMNPTEKDDGRLTVNEVFGINISSKLVILSACQTGLGEIDGGDDLVGLSRAFLYAGSPTVIVSLWNVDDATTAWLMTRFYHYLTGGNSSSEALAYAQRDLLSQKLDAEASAGPAVGFSDEIRTNMTQRGVAEIRKPFYWAPFVLIGNGTSN